MATSTLLSATGILRRLFRKPSLRWIYRHVDLALYPGQRNKEYLRACGVREAKLAWMPHCVDNDQFAAGGLEPESKARNWRRALGIAGAHTAFLFAGKLVSHKQPDLLLQAFLAHASTNPESHLIFAGAGPMESDLRAMATNRKNIHFLGFCNQQSMPVVYRLGDVYLLPSSRDTWGLGVNEAMASSRPIIVSNLVGCAPDLAENKRYARVFPSGRTHKLTHCLDELARNRAMLPELGVLARSEIQKWSVSAAADALYRQLQYRAVKVTPPIFCRSKRATATRMQRLTRF